MEVLVKHLSRLMFAAFTIATAALAYAAPFNDAQFEAAQAAGKPVLVTVQADWCPTCAKQQPVVNELLLREDMKGFQQFTIDFDRQKPLLKRFGVQMQSTLVVFKGRQEVGRSTGETTKQRISALLRKAL